MQMRMKHYLKTLYKKHTIFCTVRRPFEFSNVNGFYGRRSMNVWHFKKCTRLVVSVEFLPWQNVYRNIERCDIVEPYIENYKLIIFDSSCISISKLVRRQLLLKQIQFMYYIWNLSPVQSKQCSSSVFYIFKFNVNRFISQFFRFI